MDRCLWAVRTPAFTHDNAWKRVFFSYKYNSHYRKDELMAIMLLLCCAVILSCIIANRFSNKFGMPALIFYGGFGTKWQTARPIAVKQQWFFRTSTTKIKSLKYSRRIIDSDAVAGQLDKWRRQLLNIRCTSNGAHTDWHCLCLSRHLCP